MTSPALAIPLLMLTATSWARAIPVSPEYEGNCQRPHWSPDGSRLAYEVNQHDRKVVETWVLTPGEGPPAQVRPIPRGASALTAGFTTSSKERVVHELEWSPGDGAEHVYTASGPDRDYDIYLGASALVRGPGADGGPAWSPDGRWLAFTSARTGQGDIYLLDLNDTAGSQRRLTTDPTSAELYATWSPDGRRLAYVGHNDQGDGVFVLDSISSPTPRAVTDWGRTQTRPSFSPDGRHLAFYSNHVEPARFDLYVAPAAGGAPRLVEEGVVMNSRGPTWTPGGAHLVYVRDDKQRFDPVYVVPVDSPPEARSVPTRTVGNGDLDVVKGTDGRTYLAVAAQGVEGDERRDFKRIYVMELPSEP